MNSVIEKVKAKYPQYADVPDDELTTRIADKYPQYLEIPDFEQDVQRIKMPDEQALLPQAERTSDLAAAQKQARLSGEKSERALNLLGGAEFQAERLQPQRIIGTISKNIVDLPYAVGHAINAAVPPEAPRVDPESIKPFIRHAMTGATQPSIGEENTATEGVVSGSANVLAGLVSPETGLAIATGAAAPEVVAKLFVTDIAGQLPGTVDKLLSAKTPKERAEAGVELAAQAGTLKLLHSGLARAEAKPGPIESLVDAEARRGMTPTQPPPKGTPERAASSQVIDITPVSESTLDRLEAEAKSPETKVAEAVGPATAKAVEQTKGLQNASEIPSAESVSEREVRSSMGEKTPLRQQGAPAATQEPSPQGSVNAPELAGGAQGEARDLAVAESKAQAQVTKTAISEGQRSAKAIKDDLISELQEKLQQAPAAIDWKPGDGATVTVEIPDDGKFTVKNTVEAISELLARAKKIKTDDKPPGVPKKAIKYSEKAIAATAGMNKTVAEAKAELAARGEPPISEASGIGIAPGAGAYKAIGEKLASFREKIASGWASRGNKADIARLKDAADSEAKIIANQQRKSVELEAQKEFGDETSQALKAVTAVIEAGGDHQRLMTFLAQSYGKHLEGFKAAVFAHQNWDRLQPLVAKIKAIQDNQIAQEHLVGIDTEYRENYIRHAIDVDKLPNRGAEFFGSGAGAGTRSGFKAGRKFNTLYDLIQSGRGDAIKSFNAAKLVESRLQAGQQLVNDRMWVNGFKSVNDPTTGNPIVGPPVTYDKNHFPIAAPGYDAVGVAGQFIAVHNGYRGIFDTVTGASKLQNAEVGGLPVGAAVLNTAAGIKHGLLLFDTFHASRIIQKQFFLTGHVGWAKGLSILEYNAGDLAEAVRQGEITQEMADFANANRPTAQLLVKNGLNVGRIQEALRSEVVRNWPIVGPFNRWVFDKVTRGAMMEASLTEFERVQGANPTWRPEQVAAKVAKDINVTFGNIGRQGIFRGRTGQDLMRLVALAPQWVESMARSEIGGFGQLAAAPFNGMKLGTLGKTMAGGLISYVAATQVLNYITRGHSTFENPEDGHKLDAWIPDLAFKMGLSKKDSGGFFLSPLSVVAELTHDAYRYAFRQDNAIDILGQIGQNKMSPLLRSQKVLWTGKNYSGEKIVDTWKRIAQSGAALIPAPIPVSGFASDRPGQAQRQLFGSAGVKMEPAPTAVQQIGAKARDFTAKHGKPAEVDIVYHEGSPYNSLRKSLRSGDDAGAKAAIQELRKTRKDSDIVNAMAKSKTHPFTGSAAMESKFKASLSPQERELYDKAKAEKKATYEQFQKVWRERGPR